MRVPESTLRNRILIVKRCCRKRYRQDYTAILGAGLSLSYRSSFLGPPHRLKEWFHEIVSQGDVEALDAWSREAAGSGLKQFQSIARSFRQDYEAIKLALTTPWSTGQCEGQICRVKLIKRIGYGRAKPDLLRQRVLHRCAA